LARREQAAEQHVSWIPGALDQPRSLVRLLQGADALIHVAGVINARNRQGFHSGNIAGTLAVIAAAREAGVRRVIHVSSLAAREPGLSDYGWSKAESEAAIRASGLDWTIVRPPAVYGPGDREMLELFRMAARGLVLLPPGGRLSLIEAGDLGRLLLDLVPSAESVARSYEPDDGVGTGWDHRDFAHALGEAVGRPVLPLSVPAAMLRLASLAEGLVRRGGAKLTADRVRYFCHPDWVVGPEARPPATIWSPTVETRSGLKATAEWYRAEGWL
jgi:uncharacterized protein YbjT (DUF2867 family)